MPSFLAARSAWPCLAGACKTLLGCKMLDLVVALLGEEACIFNDQVRSIFWKQATAYCSVPCTLSGSPADDLCKITLGPMKANLCAVHCEAGGLRSAICISLASGQGLAVSP